MEIEFDTTVEAIIEEFRNNGADADFGRLAHLAETAASYAAKLDALPSTQNIVDFYQVFGVVCCEVELLKLSLQWSRM